MVVAPVSSAYAACETLALLADVSGQLPKPSEDVLFRDFGDEAVLVHRDQPHFSLNATQSRFWALLVTERDRDRIEQQLLEEFEVDAAVLRDEIDGLIVSLAAEGLIG